MEDFLNEQTKKGLRDLLPEFDVKTIVGEEFLIDGAKVFPVIKISTGYVGGGSEIGFKKKRKGVFSTNGYGSTCEPIGFFVAGKSFEFIPIKQEQNFLKIVKSVAKSFETIFKTNAKMNMATIREKNENAKK